MRSRIEPMKKIARPLRQHREPILNYVRAQKLLSSGVVEGLNNKAKVTMRKSYGFRTFRCLELALYQSLGKIPEPDSTHDFSDEPNPQSQTNPIFLAPPNQPLTKKNSARRTPAIGKPCHMTSRQIRRAQERRTRKLAKKSERLAAEATPQHPFAPAEAPAIDIRLPEPTESIPTPRTRAEINRRNSQFSTGPRSQQGKAKSSMNPLKHGFCGVFSILPSESEQDFDNLLAALRQDHQPANTTEDILVARMAQHHWLGQRAIRLQTELLSNDGLVQQHDKTFSLYLRYQTANERAFSKCLQDLLKLRAAQRQAENDARKAHTEILKQEQREADEKRKQKAADHRKFVAGLEAEQQSDLAFVERMRNMPLHELLGRPVPDFGSPK